jgi:hypothetical protein
MFNGCRILMRTRRAWSSLGISACRGCNLSRLTPGAQGYNLSRLCRRRLVEICPSESSGDAQGYVGVSAVELFYPQAES